MPSATATQAAPAPGPHRTAGRILARNSLLNLFGWGLPMVAALVTVPLLIRGLGTDRFGILTVGWVVIGYFGLFDFGLGRALTKLVAEKLGVGELKAIPPLVWSTVSLMFLLGALGGGILALLAPWIVHTGLKIPPHLQTETVRVLYLLAFSLPWVISTTGFLGVLEANQSFGVVNALRIPMGLFNYVGPLLVFPFSHSLVPVIGLLLVGRLLAWGAHLAACLRVLPVLRRYATLGWSELRVLARFGGWMTVSNTVSPLMTYLDRFLIGALLSMSAVAYYVTPYELVTKLWLVPSALMGVLFPAFAASFAEDRDRTARLFDRGVRAIFLVMFPVTLVIVTLAHEGMRLWLGAVFASHSSGVLRWLAVGVFINCLGQVPFALLQGIGRPDLTGKLHLAELPLYGAAIWGFSRMFGLEGVAMAWVLRVAVDAVVLFVMAERFVPRGAGLLRGTARMVLVAVAVFGIAALQTGLGVQLAFVGGTLVLFALLAWWRILEPGERALVPRPWSRVSDPLAPR